VESGIKSTFFKLKIPITPFLQFLYYLVAIGRLTTN